MTELGHNFADPYPVGPLVFNGSVLMLKVFNVRDQKIENFASHYTKETSFKISFSIKHNLKILGSGSIGSNN